MPSNQIRPLVTIDAKGYAIAVDDKNNDILRELSWRFNKCEAVNTESNELVYLRFIRNIWIESTIP